MHFLHRETGNFFAGRSIRRYEKKIPLEGNYFLEIPQSLTSMKLWPISSKNLMPFLECLIERKRATTLVFMRLNNI